MVEGFKLRIDSTELADHCLARAAHHHERAEAKIARLEEARTLAAALAPEMSAANVATMTKTGNYYQADPRQLCENLETDIREHNNKAATFQFFAAHLFNDTYTLSESDLQRLEILKR